MINLMSVVARAILFFMLCTTVEAGISWVNGAIKYCSTREGGQAWALSIGCASAEELKHVRISCMFRDAFTSPL